jgi:hypothetical protein
MANLIEYYLDLLTSQWRPAPNLNAWLTVNLQLFQDVMVCAQSFAAAFDITTAVGAQLDVLGVIIGQPRQVGFQPSNSVSPILDDATYRLLLQARIAQNHWNGQIDSLIAMWKTLFPGGTIVVNDHQNMTVSLTVAGSFTSIISDLILRGEILPRPQGVGYVYASAVTNLPILGFDRSDAYVSGLDQGHFA